MSFDPEVYSRMNELCALYQRRWGKPVDLIGCPNVLSQEKIVRILERIVDTGESIVVGYEKIRNEEHCFLIERSGNLFLSCMGGQKWLLY